MLTVEYRQEWVSVLFQSQKIMSTDLLPEGVGGGGGGGGDDRT